MQGRYAIIKIYIMIMKSIIMISNTWSNI